MKRFLLPICILLILTGAAFAAGPGPEFGMKGGVADPTPPAAGGNQEADFVEGFEDITMLTGWVRQNNSSPLGINEWFQGNDTVFAAQAGPPTSYIAANFNSTAGGTGTISNWLVTPELDFSVFDTLTFWTRTVTGSIFPDGMEVRMSTNGASSDVGTLATDVGDFTDLLIEINPTLAVGGFPETWTEFTVSAADLSTSSGTGRLAFRYLVTGAGPAGANSNYIGIDSVAFVERLPSAIEIPTAGTLGLVLLTLMLAVGAFVALRRRSVV